MSMIYSSYSMVPSPSSMALLHNSTSKRTAFCSNRCQNQNSEGEGLCAVLHMSPTTTTTGDIVQMSPSTCTRLCLRVITSHNQIVSPHEHNTRYNNHTSTCETTGHARCPISGDMGCQDSRERPYQAGHSSL